jgi:hypothetical protein
MQVLTALDEGYVDFAAEEVGNSIGTILEKPSSAFVEPFNVLINPYITQCYVQLISLDFNDSKT